MGLKQELKILFGFEERLNIDSGIITLNKYGNTKFKISTNIEAIRIGRYGREKKALDYFINLTEKSKVTYDIGASVGLFTVIAANRNSKVQIYSFEPDPETFNRLNENVKLNELNNVTILQIACCDKNGKVALFTDGVDGYAPSMARQADREGAPEKTVEVECKSIDYLINELGLPAPDLIKIDIEGAEFNCLKGAENILNGNLEKKPNDIFCEIHPVFLKDFNSSKNEVIEFLIQYDYDIVWQRKRHDQIHVHFQLRK